MRGGKPLISVFAAMVAVFVFAAPAIAQEGAWGSDVEDFNVQAPAELKAETGGGGDPDFGAALEAAAAAETKPAADKEGFVPKNEIEVVKKTDGAAAPKTEKKKKEKQPKAEDGKRLNSSMGGRLGVGNVTGLGLGFGIGFSEANRIGLGGHFGWGTGEEAFTAYISEAYGFFDWRYTISDDGALSWFVGPGAAFGWYGTSGEKKMMVIKRTVDSTGAILKPDEKYDTTAALSKFKGFNIGLGGHIGLEVDLSIIDPDHALSSLRSCSVGLDLCPMIYLFNQDIENFPKVVITMGFTFKYEFGKIRKASGG
jgi:hypothetical protein